MKTFFSRRVAVSTFSITTSTVCWPVLCRTMTPTCSSVSCSFSKSVIPPTAGTGCTACRCAHVCVFVWERRCVWMWLCLIAALSVQKPGVPLSRGTLITHCYSDLGFMDFICSMVTRTIEVSQTSSCWSWSCSWVCSQDFTQFIAFY